MIITQTNLNLATWSFTLLTGIRFSPNKIQDLGYNFNHSNIHAELDLLF